MTNEEIIMSNRVFLMENGVINGTGRTFIFTDEQGTREIEVPEEIHTFNEWKKLGYIVKKGEHSVAKFPIWQKTNKKKKEEDNAGDENNGKGGDKNDYYYKKVAFFFTKEQVKASNA